MILALFLLIIVAVIVSIVFVLAVPGNSEDHKKCQHCGKRVKIETVVCRYCKKDLVDLPYR
ncbi:MAG: hypothetical protein DWQ47_02020 [Acidobacteria bacterium]|nr:MAG: hypothetical protein DWQ32_05570 [Acidobacteriota bacterium]REK01199.1 MAG: hypothetical protein DWQ38_02005 [Acidobacteriota bacterium]REK14155.1 MAG: hypothetical protein DWQ43_11260 [Acidobacteriota bacterium]REK44870.1 MAG: hypothetical protein DWQ47_02020 [Acidobacteriota bacterium]